MRFGTLITAAAAAVVSACATTAGTPQAMAEQQCSALVRQEGLRLVQMNGVAAQTDAQVVQMRVEDALGRRFDTSCAVASNGLARWAQPLPDNIARARS